MKNKVIKTIAISILILMGLYDLGGISAGSSATIINWSILFIVLLCTGYYFILRWMLNIIDKRGWLNSWRITKSIFISLITLWILRAMTYIIGGILISSMNNSI